MIVKNTFYEDFFFHIICGIFSRRLQGLLGWGIYVFHVLVSHGLNIAMFYPKRWYFINVYLNIINYLLCYSIGDIDKNANIRQVPVTVFSQCLAIQRLFSDIPN